MFSCVRILRYLPYLLKNIFVISSVYHENILPSIMILFDIIVYFVITVFSLFLRPHSIINRPIHSTK
jgi:hypothetical protein